MAFALSRAMVVSLVALVIVGGAATLAMGATNTLLQTNAPDDVCGRLMSIYSLITAGFMPLGGLLLGAASLTGSVTLVVVVATGVVLTSVLVIGTGARALRRMT